MREDINRMMRDALDSIMEQIAAGVPARDAVAGAFSRFRGEFLAKLRKALASILADTPSDISRMRIGKITLSQRLYQMEDETALNVERILRRHTREMKTAREAALAIYDGYERGGALDVKIGLPRYIHQVKPLAKAYENEFAKLTASKLKTPYLKAAYKQAIDAIERGVGQKVLKTKLDVAVYERNRYLADRITQTEMHRARMRDRARKLQQDPAVEWVQVRMSQTHPKTDICDYHSSVDFYGLGPGVYRKAEAPLSPFHPFCRCMLSPRVDLYGVKANRNGSAESDYMASLSEEEGRRVVGSRAKYAEVMDGKGVEAVYYGEDLPDRVGDY